MKHKAPSPRKAIVRTLEQLGRSHGLRRVWEDWTEAMALWAVNWLGTAQPSFRDELWETREARYRQLASRYKPEEWLEICGLLGQFLEIGSEMGRPSAEGRTAWHGGGDPLGELYMELEFGNERAGQFFTPWDLCVLSSRMIFDSELKEKVDQQGFVTVSDPACGSGTKLLALAHTAMEQGVQPQRQIWFHGRDLSASAVHMAIVNLTIHGLPGVIEHGNTITDEVFERWVTPWHVLGLWERKLQHRHSVEPPVTPIASVEE